LAWHKVGVTRGHKGTPGAGLRSAAAMAAEEVAGRARALSQGSAQRALARISGCRLTGAKDIARNIRTGPRRSGGLSEYVGVVIALLPTGRARTHTINIL
jgi:hypothetical protein